MSKLNELLEDLNGNFVEGVSRPDREAKRVMARLTGLGYKKSKSKMGMSPTGATYGASDGSVWSKSLPVKTKHFGAQPEPDEKAIKGAIRDIELSMKAEGLTHKEKKHGRVYLSEPGKPPRISYHITPKGVYIYVDVSNGLKEE